MKQEQPNCFGALRALPNHERAVLIKNKIKARGWARSCGCSIDDKHAREDLSKDKV